MPRITHFEIHADDIDRASKFYGELFGWTFTKWVGPVDYVMIQTGPEGTPSALEPAPVRSLTVGAPPLHPDYFGGPM